MNEAISHMSVDASFFLSFNIISLADAKKSLTDLSELSQFDFQKHSSISLVKNDKEFRESTLTIISNLIVGIDTILMMLFSK